MTNRFKTVKNILIVDDEEMPTQLYQQALEDSAYKVTVAQTTDEAIKILERSIPPDLVILDCMMPPGDVFRDDPNVEDGMRSGLMLWDKIARIGNNTKTMFLTNVRANDLLDEMKRRAGPHRVKQKGRTPPSALVHEVRDILS